MFGGQITHSKESNGVMCTQMLSQTNILITVNNDDLTSHEMLLLIMIPWRVKAPQSGAQVWVA